MNNKLDLYANSITNYISELKKHLRLIQEVDTIHNADTIQDIDIIYNY